MSTTADGRAADSRPLDAGGSDLRAQLAPVRTAVLSEARAEGRRLVADAQASADRLVAAARHDLDEALAARRRRLAASARVRADLMLARARHEQRAAVLAAESELRAELARRVRLAVSDVRDDPRYPALLDHLEQLARRQLGPGALVERDPDGVGGIVASSGGRRVDYGLDALADRAFAAIEPEVASLWT